MYLGEVKSSQWRISYLYCKLLSVNTSIWMILDTLHTYDNFSSMERTDWIWEVLLWYLTSVFLNLLRNIICAVLVIKDVFLLLLPQ